MELVEIRDLDGPNMFLLCPAIKLELVLDADEPVPEDSSRRLSEVLGMTLPETIIDALPAVVSALHERAGLTPPEAGWRALDTPDHLALFYPWEWRGVARRIAELAVAAIDGELNSDDVDALPDILANDQRCDDRPEYVRDEDRRIPAVGVTGTNGKTTTTRLLSHIVRARGQHVGWCSTSGVYIDGELVLDGDYTGPAGARRVLADPLVEVAVLETARGGILLRGLGYESNDVSVMLNVSADHLDMHGIATIGTLAEVKSVVIQVTRPEGTVVLNADDPLVLAQRARVRASIALTSQDANNPAIQAHVADGGWAVVRDLDDVVLLEGESRTLLFNLSDAPMTYAGRARHMVENVLAASAAALSLGISHADLARGVATFTPDVRHNVGRLNVYGLDGRLVVVDYAHNESGLQSLIEFSRSLMSPGHRLRVIVGTAGDRQDSVFVALGHVAAAGADMVYLKETPKYLRGRPAGEGVAIMRGVIEAAGAGGRLYDVALGEYDALLAALDASEPGDAIAIMCVDEQLRIFGMLRDRGARPWVESAASSSSGQDA
ncbi:MAG TPA: Mur ligase family protein [Thermomicrobiales bacterium]|nr:Mur ligase family protein [Thermomicrobiales bacterium]HRA30394.1 Mur ligase family protein [Thermomicrobiales bacterium]